MTPIEFIIIAALLAFSWVFPGEGFDVSDDNHDYDHEHHHPSAYRDQLQEMWTQQVNFMRLLQEKRGFPQFPTDLASKKGQQFLKDIRNHLMEELFEAGQHLKNAKSHRATEIPEVDREAYKEELVDALHLYFELVIASGISLDELVKAYLDKGAVNDERIRSGY
jgi:hypothetical protein